MDTPIVFLLIVWSFATLSSASEYDYTIAVEAGRMSCYFQTVVDLKYHAMEIDYQVIDGGDLNINFLLLYGGNVLVQDQMKTDNSHRVSVKDQKGDYQLCFDNSFSYSDRKVVFFEIFLYDENNQLENIDYNAMAFKGKAEMGAMTEMAANVASATQRIKTSLNKAEHYQALLRAWEARDRAIMDANHTRVNFWSIVNTIVLISVGMVQVYLIRSLFEDNTRVGRLLKART